MSSLFLPQLLQQPGVAEEGRHRMVGVIYLDVPTALVLLCSLVKGGVGRLDSHIFRLIKTLFCSSRLGVHVYTIPQKNYGIYLPVLCVLLLLYPIENLHFLRACLSSLVDVLFPRQVGGVLRAPQGPPEGIRRAAGGRSQSKGCLGRLFSL